MFNNFYEGKRVLITGHTGFKGSWLTMWLLMLGAEVTGYSLQAPTVPSLFEKSGLIRRITHVTGDICDLTHFSKIVKQVEPDYLFHLAAQPLVLSSYENPLRTYQTNVLGTLTVLEAVRLSQRPCTAIIVSTDKCYENREWEYGYREEDILGGHDPYSASKAAMEIALSSYRRSFFPVDKVDTHGVLIASVRAGNVIGGGDWSANRIVPDAIRAFSQNRPLLVRNPEAIRPWQHVLEPLSGYLWLGANLSGREGIQYAGGWNFGPLTSIQYKVGHLVKSLATEWGNGVWSLLDNQDGVHEARVLALSIEKAHSRLGWYPVWDFEDTVKHTVSGYRSFLAKDADESIIYASYCEVINSYQIAGKTKEVAWAY